MAAASQWQSAARAVLARAPHTIVKLPVLILDYSWFRILISDIPFENGFIFWAFTSFHNFAVFWAVEKLVVSSVWSCWFIYLILFGCNINFNKPELFTGFCREMVPLLASMRASPLPQPLWRGEAPKPAASSADPLFLAQRAARSVPYFTETHISRIFKASSGFKMAHFEAYLHAMLVGT